MFKKNFKFLIKTPLGFENFEGVQIKLVNSLYTFTFDDGSHIKSSGKHLFLTENGFQKTEDIKLSNTISGKKILNIEKETGTFEVYDPVGVHESSTYISNGVVSHNTEFLGSSNTLISGYKLQQIAYREPLAVHDMLKIYEMPKKTEEGSTTDHLYCICVDVSEGKNLDSSAFQVIDISSTPYKQVATYASSSISSILFPTVIYNTARMYNDAYVLVEINNNPQVADSLHIDFEYENLWKIFTGNKKPQQLSAGFARGIQMGLKMSPQVKAIGCSNLKTLIEGDKLEIVDFDTYSELTTFEQQKNSFKAAAGANDDLVMSLVSFAWVTTQQYFKEIVNHDIRKQIQMENMNQMDENMLPEPIIEDGIEHNFDIIDGDLWEVANGGEVYANFIQDRLSRL